MVYALFRSLSQAYNSDKIAEVASGLVSRLWCINQSVHDRAKHDCTLTHQQEKSKEWDRGDFDITMHQPRLYLINLKTQVTNCDAIATNL